MKGPWAWIRRRFPRVTEPKSCSAENTLPRDTDDLGELRQWLLQQAERVGRELRQDNLKGRTVTLKNKIC